MKTTVTLAMLTLALSLGASAAPPSGAGGRPPSSMPPSHPSPGRDTHMPAERSTPASHPEHDSTARAGGRSTDDILTNNTKLSSQIQDLTGADARQACSGFKNLGDCVSAAHVSKNLGIEFSELKNKVTGDNAQQLGAAVKELKPDVDTESEVRKAQREAKKDLNE